MRFVKKLIAFVFGLAVGYALMVFVTVLVGIAWIELGLAYPDVSTLYWNSFWLTGGLCVGYALAKRV